MNENTIVSLADSKYFDLLNELIESIKSFEQSKDVDICILETGLGGRLDSVTICEPITTIITPISLDHLEILGETLPEIAFEKAGIIKRGVICISAQQDSSATKVLIKEADKKGSPIHFINGENHLEYMVNIPGESQQENAKLAVLALEHINKKI